MLSFYVKERLDPSGERYSVFMMIVLLLFLQKQNLAGPTLVREQLQPMTQPGLRCLCAVDAHSAKIRSQTASADPTLHAQLHRATVFPARNGPRGPHVVSADDR